MPDVRGYYLSDQYLADELARFDGDDTDCGGQTFDPPCGGCGRCCRQQVVYYFDKARERRDRAAVYGLTVVDPGRVNLRRTVSQVYGYSGLGEHHDWWGHLMAGCRDA